MYVKWGRPRPEAIKPWSGIGACNCRTNMADHYRTSSCDLTFMPAVPTYTYCATLQPLSISKQGECHFFCTGQNYVGNKSLLTSIDVSCWGLVVSILRLRELRLMWWLCTGVPVYHVYIHVKYIFCICCIKLRTHSVHHVRIISLFTLEITCSLASSQLD